MPPKRKDRTPGRSANPRAKETPSATVGYEAQLWQMADALRGSMDAAEYKRVIRALSRWEY